MSFPPDENGDVLRRMASSGDDLNVARDVDFTVVFPDQQSASMFVRVLSVHGFHVSSQQSNVVPELPWDVVVVRHMVPSHKEIGSFEAYLEDHAASFGGRCDGWGCFHAPRI